MTPIEIEQMVKKIKSTIDNIEKSAGKKVEEVLKDLKKDIEQLKVEIEILKQGGNI